MQTCRARAWLHDAAEQLLAGAHLVSFLLALSCGDTAQHQGRACCAVPAFSRQCLTSALYLGVECWQQRGGLLTCHDTSCIKHVQAAARLTPMRSMS